MKVGALLLTGLFLAVPSGLAVSLPVAEDTLESYTSPNNLEVSHRFLETRNGLSIGNIGPINATHVRGIARQFSGSSLSREHFTNHTADALAAAFPHLNWMVIHTKYELKELHGDGGVTWGIFTMWKTRSWLPDLLYHIIGLESGKINLVGDGGDLNWAFSGEYTVAHQTDVTFLCRATRAERC